MPSTTSNYGWQYPISSDDLTSGATQIGTMINAVDTTLKTQIDAEASARAAAVNALSAVVPESNAATIVVGSSTWPAGQNYFPAPGGDWRKCIVMGSGTSGTYGNTTPFLIYGHFTDPAQLKGMRNNGGYDTPGVNITFTWMYWT